MTGWQLRENEAVAPPLLDDEFQQGWCVAEVDGSFTILFANGEQLTATEDVRSFVLTNSQLTEWYAAHNREETAMPESNRYDDDAVNDVTPELEPWLDSTVAEHFIGGGSKSPIKVRNARKLWAELARIDGLVLSRVTLAAQPGEPGADQIVAICLPDGLDEDDEGQAHPLYKQGEREVALLRYVPTTTYDAVNQITGEITERASNFDPSGYVSIVRFQESIDQAEQTMARLRELVLDYYRPERAEQRRAQQRTPDAWGVDVS